MLKRICATKSLQEIEILQAFSEEPLASHARNHCVPLYDTFQVQNEPEWLIVVMPSLRPFDSPPFQTVGEVVGCLSQLLQVLL